MTFYPGNVSATCPTRNKPDCSEKKRKQRSERGNTSVTIKRHAVSVMSLLFTSFGYWRNKGAKWNDTKGTFSLSLEE